MLVTGFCLFMIGGAYAQQSPADQPEAPAKEALPTGAPSPRASEASAAKPEPEETAASAPRLAAPHTPSLRFGLNAGTMFAGRMGGASYLEPTAFYDLSNRLRVFGSMTYLRLMRPGFWGGETNGPLSVGTQANNRVLLQVGGQYDANERLTLTGSVWRDMSALPSSYQPYRHPLAPGGNGMSFRADLKISDHFSVSGGVRYGNGNRGDFYHPMLSPYAPFGF